VFILWYMDYILYFIPLQLLEHSAKMETETQNEQLENFPDISFEELLAQEKKDSFWYD
jgi:hypothetical protein